MSTLYCLIGQVGGRKYFNVLKKLCYCVYDVPVLHSDLIKKIHGKNHNNGLY